MWHAKNNKTNRLYLVADEQHVVLLTKLRYSTQVTFRGNHNPRNKHGKFSKSRIYLAKWYTLLRLG
jgi:hypothetical protein